MFKFFGFRKGCKKVFQKECKAHQVLTQRQGLLVPQIVHHGLLHDPKDKDQWAYTLSTKIDGVSFNNLKPTLDDKIAIANDLGLLIKQIHQLPCNWDYDERFWNSLDLVSACKKSVLPIHLIVTFLEVCVTAQKHHEILYSYL